MLDPTPFEPTAEGDEPCDVSDLLEAYCQTHLTPYTTANIAYLTRQLNWPVIVTDGQEESEEAYHRELLRILRARIRGELPRASRTFERPITERFRTRLLERMMLERVRRGEQAPPIDPNNIPMEDLVQPWLFNQLYNPPGQYADLYQEIAGEGDVAAGREAAEDAADEEGAVGGGP